MRNEIKEKPIIIVGQGPSVYQLKDKIDLFKNKDVLWASLNRYWTIESEMLSSIDKPFDIICVMSRERYKELPEKGSEKLFITNSNLCLEHHIDPYGPFVYPSDLAYGFSTLFAMLCALGKLEAREIYLIGFDGQAKDKNSVYFMQENLRDDFPERVKSICRDTQMMNKIFWDYWEYIGLKREKCSIVNLEDSAIECFPKMSIEEMANEV